MLTATITHYFPWDESDDRDPIAYCGHRVTAADIHATAPTCAVCAETLDAVEAAFEATPLPLDADEARTELDPLLNAGVAERAPLSPLGAELFSLARSLVYLTLLDEVAS